MAKNNNHFRKGNLWDIYDTLCDFVESDREEYLLFKYLNNKDLDSAFSVLSECNAITAYILIFNYIYDASKYNLFTNVYNSADYRFNEFTDEIINKVSQLKPKKIIKILTSKADADGNLILYRGESSESSNVIDALSWTLNRETAVWFAKRLNFSGEGYIYTSKANISHVIAYINNREEEEILIKYEDVNITSKDIIKIPIE